MNDTKTASVDGLPVIIADIRHSARVGDYEIEQIAFLESIADRIAITERPGSSVQGEAVYQLRRPKHPDPGWYEVSKADYEALKNMPGHEDRILYTTLPPAPAAEQEDTFQCGVEAWMGQCFPPNIAHNRTERGDRLLEEVLELLQSHGYDRSRVATLVDYVYGRPVGEPAQEVGGVMVTLAAYCMVAGLNMHDEGDHELARITQPEAMAKIRRKQEAKNALHFDTPLPGNAANQPEARGVEDDQKLLALKPTAEMCIEGAKRLVRWEDNSKWPESWSPAQRAAAINEAERVFRSMWLAAAPEPVRVDEMVCLLPREALYAALREMVRRIEVCGASPELTHASSLACDLMDTVGNKFNPPRPDAVDRVTAALAGKDGANGQGPQSEQPSVNKCPHPGCVFTDGKPCAYAHCPNAKAAQA